MISVANLHHFHQAYTRYLRSTIIMMLYQVFLEYLDNISSIDKLHYFVLVNRFLFIP